MSLLVQFKCGISLENLREKKATEELRRKLDERREKRQIEQKLAQVRTLAHTTADDDDNAVSWVEKSRRIQKEKEEANKRAKMLEEIDEAFGVGDMVTTELIKQKAKAYTSRDLRGIKVEHDRVSHRQRILLFEPVLMLLYFVRK
jgi:U4/U6.U5 tri-snRNP-associated protein 1